MVESWKGKKRCRNVRRASQVPNALRQRLGARWEVGGDKKDADWLWGSESASRCDCAIGTVEGSSSTALCPFIMPILEIQWNEMIIRRILKNKQREMGGLASMIHLLLNLSQLMIALLNMTSQPWSWSAGVTKRWGCGQHLYLMLNSMDLLNYIR